MQNHYHSWGHYPTTSPKHVHPIHWKHEAVPFHEWSAPVLPFAYGRSYGDSCQNDGGVLLTTRKLDRFIAFDPQLGILRCEAGVSLSHILEHFVPRGWFLPVTPGTKYVSVGGAIANDVHGKNHHQSGTFGCHVLTFEILRSTGERVTCAPGQHTDLFQATIGGLGLTGLILWADIRLKPITAPFMSTERIRFSTLDEFFDLTNDSDDRFEYSVAWIDCLSSRGEKARGVFIRGNHCLEKPEGRSECSSRNTLTIPCQLPSGLLNSWSMKVFNTMYYQAQPTQLTHDIEPYEGFFYPLDGLLHWNRIYGSPGFLQYQCVIPESYERTGIGQLLEMIYHARQGSFLSVLKKFGQVRSPGMLSFPRAGTTLALDFPFLGEKTLALLTKLDSVVLETGGAVYPAKDARMTPDAFQRYFPKWEEFLRFKDSRFSSSFWRRVTSPIEGPDREEHSSLPLDAIEKESSFSLTG